MTLGALVLTIGLVALLITIAMGYVRKGLNHWLMSFLQNFTGVLFLISGWVKAVDPMGTGFKLEQYFAEFEATFQGTAFDFMAPAFPFMAKYAIGLSVFMIVFEMVLGVMLILGYKPKLTSWLFFLLVAFFTVLTGFTYLTGYVPSGENFFNFSAWGAYDPNNMRVTDCGCFGDFIKLEPMTSFFKDIVLLFPAVFFVLKHRDMHQLLNRGWRFGITAVVTIGLILYCFQNYLWDLPHMDFRPFQVNVNIAKQKALEEEAMANVQIVAWKLKNRKTGEQKQLPNGTFLREYASYPKEKWEVIEQVKSKPAIEKTKISDFEVLDPQGNSVTDKILQDPDPAFMIISHKLKGETRYAEVAVRDTVYVIDSVYVEELDSVLTQRRIKEIRKNTEYRERYDWDQEFVKRYTEQLHPFLREAMENGVSSYLIAGGASGPKLQDFERAINSFYPVYEADDILLKTIIRSNPGIVLMQNGVIRDKWHIKKLPSFEEVRREYLTKQN